MSTTINTGLGSGILTIDQAAMYLSIPKATLYTCRTRRAGFGPRAVKLGGCLRYRRSDLDEWVAEHVESFDDDQTLPRQRTGDGISLSRASAPGDRSVRRRSAKGPTDRGPGSATRMACPVRSQPPGRPARRLSVPCATSWSSESSQRSNSSRQTPPSRSSPNCGCSTCATRAGSRTPRSMSTSACSPRSSFPNLAGCGYAN